MRSYCCLFVLAVVSFPALISANNTTPLEEEPVTLVVSTTPKPLCKERMCPRIYMPVCGLVDGKMVTAPSRCDLNNKIKCSLSLRRSLGSKVPRVRFLHNGPCSPNKDESTVVRMRDETPAVEVKDDEGKNKTNKLDDSIELIDIRESYEDGDDSDESDEISSSEEEAEARKVELKQLELEAMQILDAHEEVEADMSEAEADKAQEEADLEEELTDWDALYGDNHDDHDDHDEEDRLDKDHDGEDYLDEDYLHENHDDGDHFKGDYDEEDHYDEDHGNKDEEVGVAKGDGMDDARDDKGKQV
ncbi:uncharacterized protein DDB_G0283697 [Ceratitis capitata]|nr:uncharacterized protein DDB_G0283697 [Ceratitis capitata]